MNIICIYDQDFQVPIKYFIDCPCDSELEASKVRRIEIPRALAAYIKELQEKRDRLTAENEKLKDKVLWLKQQGNEAYRVPFLEHENAELKERLKGTCTIEVDPNCELAKPSPDY